MTVEEALQKWTHCRQCSHWKGNFSPEENDSPTPNLARKIGNVSYKGCQVEEVEHNGLWPSGVYTAMVRVYFPATKSGPGENAVMIPERHVCYLAVR